MRKAQFLVIIVVAALVLLAALPLSFHDGSVQLDTSVFGYARRVMKDTPLLRLPESVGQSQPNPAPSQADNSTAPVTSSGAVKASFTVVTESRASPTSSAASDPTGTCATTPAQAVSGASANDQSVPGDQLGTAADVHPKSGGLTVGGVLLVAASSAAVAAVCGLAIPRVRARKRVLGYITTG